MSKEKDDDITEELIPKNLKHYEAYESEDQNQKKTYKQKMDTTPNKKNKLIHLSVS